jgi:hypothetical protein
MAGSESISYVLYIIFIYVYTCLCIHTYSSMAIPQLGSSLAAASPAAVVLLSDDLLQA